MPRVTQPEVETIVDVDAGDSLFPMIEAASSLVDDCCVKLKPTPPYPYTNAKLKLIEKWLSAHFYCVWRARETQEFAGSVGAMYQSKVDLGLSVTHYGQQAMRLDTGGGLAALDNGLKKVVGFIASGKKGKVSWVGTDDCPDEDSD